VRVVNDRRVGGQIYEDWGDGTGKLYGTIGCGDGTVLRHDFSAFGPISDEMAEGIEWHGSLETFKEQLTAWIDRGEVVPPPSD
jgi:hypothetical protein